MWGALGRSDIHTEVWCKNLKEEENWKAKTKRE
jgi:hypothetical protein